MFRLKTSPLPRGSLKKSGRRFTPKSKFCRVKSKSFKRTTNRPQAAWKIEPSIGYRLETLSTASSKMKRTITAPQPRLNIVNRRDQINTERVGSRMRVIWLKINGVRTKAVPFSVYNLRPPQNKVNQTTGLWRPRQLSSPRKVIRALRTAFGTKV